MHGTDARTANQGSLFLGEVELAGWSLIITNFEVLIGLQDAVEEVEDKEYNRHCRPWARHAEGSAFSFGK